MKILVINPGSTSTKLAIYSGEEKLVAETISYSRESLQGFADLYEQLDLRVTDMMNFLSKNLRDPGELDGIAARGGMLPPLSSGAYVVDEKLVHVLRHEAAGMHASNLGGLMAWRLKEHYGIPAWIYDAVSVDEMMDEARISGIREWPRKAFSHALNTRAVALRFCREKDLDYRKTTLILAHIGGGISLNIQQNGRMIDTIAGQEGPFSTERAGALDVFDCAAICEKFGVAQLRRFETGEGGLVSYLGTNSALQVSEMAAAGNAEAILLRSAMALQIAKYIALLAADVSGNVDAIILTGGVAHWRQLCEEISGRVSFIAPVHVRAGEFEMEALAAGIGRVLNGEEEAKRWAD